MSRFWSSIVGELDPYVPGEQPKIEDLVKLNTNENPYGPSPKVLDIISQEASDALRLYPDPNGDVLKQTIAKYYEIQPNQVFVGNGSDEVLAHTFLGLLKHSQPLLYPDITYSFYPVYCGLFEINSLQIPLNDDFEIELREYLQPNGGVIIANPNAPTGRFLPLAEIEAFLRLNKDSVVVVDEAYIDFGGESAVRLIDSFPNILVIQTFSKSRSLAGLRVGFAMGNTELIGALERVKNSFNSYPLGRLALMGAAEAIKDDVYFQQQCKKIIATRERLIEGLDKHGFVVIPSYANFVFARHPTEDAKELMKKLREKSILVRHFTMERIDQFLRITIGTDKECNLLLHELDEILNV